jgi:hypothetical protein
MKDIDEMDRLLKTALSPLVEPDDEINRKILNSYKENVIMKNSSKKRFTFAILVASLTLLMSVTALAAWKLLSADQVAKNLGDEALAKAFQEENAVAINQSVISGGYDISLLGIVSGEGISDFGGMNINPDRTYAVVSITNEDGTPMPATQDEDYGKVSFFVSPLIKGQKPWLYNIMSMNGSYSEFVKDGIMYRLIECDDIEKFADRGLYLCVSTGTFYDTDAYHYNEETGEITPNTAYDGANALFDLPLDTSGANYEEAQAYLDSLFEEDTPDASDSSGNEDTAKNPDSSLEDTQESLDLDALMEKAVLIPESVKEVTSEDGKFTYEYNGNKVSCDVRWLFEEGQTGLSDAVAISDDGNTKTIIRYSRDENGVITAMAYQVQD